MERDRRLDNDLSVGRKKLKDLQERYRKLQEECQDPAKCMRKMRDLAIQRDSQWKEARVELANVWVENTRLCDQLVHAPTVWDHPLHLAMVLGSFG